MDKSTEDLIKDGEFAEFVLREAESTIVHASVEELAVFGFGSLEDAIESYRERLELKENHE
jgi:hypothetical protein